MAKIIRAEYSGFCFGVKRAIELAKETAQNAKGKKVYSLGQLIHNQAVTEKLAKEGVQPVQSISEMEKGSIVIIRSHGVGSDVYEEAEASNLIVSDATCPFVSKIHKLVKAAYDDGKKIVIAGDKNHPEVQGINGWCENSALIVSDEKELENMDKEKCQIFLVAQTTLKQEIFGNIEKKLKTLFGDIEVKNTICYATEERQKSCKKLSERVDAMVVIGDKNSSNSQKLYEIAKKSCKKAYFIENMRDLPLQEMQFYNTIGVVAGASTPEHLIEEVIANMSENITEIKETNPMDEFMAEIDKASKLPRTGENVEGTVIEVRDREIIVNICCKKDAIIPKDELSTTDEGELKDLFKVGDTIKARVLKHDDGDGNILLSRKKIEAEKYWDELKVAYEEKQVVEVKLVKEVKGGVLAQYKDVTGFIPYSGLSDKYVDKAEGFVGKTLKVKILKVDTKKGRAVFSHRFYLYEMREKTLDEIWNALSVGDIVEGTVMRFTEYGAFVDIGGLDGLLHISEISWGKLNHPQEILQIGQKIPVKILSMNRENEKIALGYKQTTPQPWTTIEGKYEEGQRVKGKVVQIKEFGAFVEIEPGLDGLVHISQISYDRVDDVEKVLKPDQEVEAVIIGIDYERRRISLSIKATLERPARLQRADADREGNPEPVSETVEETAETVQEMPETVEETETAEQAE